MLAEKIAPGTARVGIVGLGYVGSPGGGVCKSRLFRYRESTLVESKVARINAGDSYIQDIPHRRKSRRWWKAEN